MQPLVTRYVDLTSGIFMSAAEPMNGVLSA